MKQRTAFNISLLEKQEEIRKKVRAPLKFLLGRPVTCLNLWAGKMCKMVALRAT